MIIGSTKFPRWSAPVVGAIAGVAFFDLRLRTDFAREIWWNVLGACCGLLAGGFVYFFESPASRRPAVALRPATPAQKIMGVLSVPMGGIPVAGLVFCSVALGINRHCADWPRQMALIGFFCSVTVSIALVIVLVLLKNGVL